MSLKSIKKLSFKSQLPILAGMVLVFGLFAVVSGTQQRQDTRSRAAGYGGTGNCLIVDVSSGEDLVGDNCTIDSGFNGSVIGDGNVIRGGVGGPVGNVIGNNNNVQGGVNGCVKGNDNYIQGGVNGAVVGTGNTILGAQGSGTCPPTPPTAPPTQPPAPTPTTRPFGTCKDGIDNNQNELIDGGDPVCHTDGNPNNPGSYDPYSNEIAVPTPTSIPTPTPTPTPPNGTCADGIDNNQNELIDGGDPVCHTDGNPNNPGSYDPRRNETVSTTPTIPVPTITVAPGNTSIKLNLYLHGLGQGGDAANPNSGGNANPLRPQRNVKVEVFNGQNQLLVTKDGSIQFNSTLGNFIGTFDLGNNLPTGVYTVKVKTDQFLKTLVPGIQNLVQGTVNQLPKTVMVNGDIDGNNQINILDYNILIGCYSDFLPAPSCTAANKPLSDLDDDGDVNQFDYNLFIRELTNREGQ